MFHRINTLGEPTIESPLQRFGGDNYQVLFTSDNERVTAPVRMEGEIEDDHPEFERAGARKKVFFDSKMKAAIVTCGGLCPGINDVIRAIVMELYYRYDVHDIYGACYGYLGLVPAAPEQMVRLTPPVVLDIHRYGGSILGTSRGPQSPAEIVENLERMGINALFCVGGDGTLRGAREIALEINRRSLAISIVGIPKTIDNDIPFVYRSFGMQTAVEEARRVIDCAHVEARGAYNGLGLVKLMGREAGFIAAYATLASRDVNYCLVPEAPFPLEGPEGLIEHLLARMERSKHAVIALSEGAGRHLIGETGARDASGNIQFHDIGLFVKEKIQEAFKARGVPIAIKYFDPSYIVRSVHADSQDSVYCGDLAGNAVHAAMAGKTGLLIGYWHGVFTHVPLEAIHGQKKTLDPNRRLWQSVLATTGQPAWWGHQEPGTDLRNTSTISS